MSKILCLIITTFFLAACQPLKTRTPSQIIEPSETESEAVLTSKEIAWQQTHEYFSNQDYKTALEHTENSYPLLETDKEQQAYLVAIWKRLQALDEKTLNNLWQETNDDYQRGWIEFVLLSNANASLDALPQKLAMWQTAYPEHPANVLISPAHLITPPKKIALLLPLSGILKNQGESIRNGFLAAFYQQNTSGYRPEIAIYDTNSNAIVNLYQQAKEQGADFIVGPLLKENINTLVSNHQINVPTLALNNVTIDTAMLYQFGLSPDVEAAQVAEQIASEEQRVLIITPDNAWGRRIDKDFTKTFESVNGETIARLNYRPQNLSYQLSRFLHVNQSWQRAKAINRLLQEKPRYTARRRRDFNAIFLVASPAMGRQILPLLRFYYANDVPIYSISQIYTGQPNPYKDRDLNGIRFVDLPWVIKPASLSQSLKTIQKNIQTTWPSNYKNYSRFYALGVDAYNLIPELNRLLLLPKLGIPAATGTLSLQNNQQIYRELAWATIKNGKPKEILRSLNTKHRSLHNKIENEQ